MNNLLGISYPWPSYYYGRQYRSLTVQSSWMISNPVMYVMLWIKDLFNRLPGVSSNAGELAVTMEFLMHTGMTVIYLTFLYFFACVISLFPQCYRKSK